MACIDIYKLENHSTKRTVWVNFENEITNYLRRWGCKNIKNVLEWANRAWFGDQRTFGHITITIIDTRGKHFY
jgi:hypothetical protein